MTLQFEHRRRRALRLLSRIMPIALAFTLASCDDDSSTGPGTAPVELTHVVRSVDPIQSRFFRLTAPVSFYFTDPDSFPMPLRDQSLDYVRSGQNLDAPWQIDYASLRVYRSSGPGVSNSDTIDDAVAYLDPKGVGFEGFGAGTGLTPGDSGPNPGFPYSGFDPSLALAHLPQEYFERWQQLSAPDEWSVLEVNGEIIGIQLARPATESEAIAVSYDIVSVADWPAIVRRVGRSPEDGEQARIEDPNNPGRQVYYFKLLKPGGPIEPPFDMAAYTEFALTWEYEYRNFYDLGGTEISPDFLEFRIISTDPTLDPPDRMPADLDSTQTRFVQVFGIDRQTRTGVWVPDGVADIEDQRLFHLESGFMRFPYPAAMSPPDSLVAEWTNGEAWPLPDEMSAPGLYTGPLTPTDREALHHFDFVVKWVE